MKLFRLSIVEDLLVFDFSFQCSLEVYFLVLQNHGFLSALLINIGAVEQMLKEHSKRSSEALCLQSFWLPKGASEGAAYLMAANPYSSCIFT